MGYVMFLRNQGYRPTAVDYVRWGPLDQRTSCGQRDFFFFRGGEIS
ncbi:hypothetical protein SLEP1_g57777 [Rubroshorea leprosula]|uniref:Uncharacterized protein n=1 Tax=Rubroshorea leprosula TaxID=152421 RepID=A0AAV5MRS7_9ROSI|nr:hypothetical protein SLEP1_g57777 [Rubroshorea leprosula]